MTSSLSQPFSRQHSSAARTDYLLNRRTIGGPECLLRFGPLHFTITSEEIGFMTKDGILNSIKGKLIVSCQALADEPLHSPFIMGRMALAALEGGAGGIRANTPEDVSEIKRVVDLPVIGLFKKVYPDSDVYITPTLDEISAMVECGSEIVAMDATDRLHPGFLSLDDVFAQARKKYPDQLFMADCSTLEECLHAQEIGFDLVGTTMPYK